jgi:XTP/dITP diphosphohydrolase
MTPSTLSIVLGTRNAKKCREMAALIAPPWEPNPRLARLSIRSVGEFPAAPEVVEDADTFAGNARKKAAEAARAIGAWVIADDSGLAVDALGGAPGVLSARYAGEPSDDEANNRKLLEAVAGLDDVPDPRVPQDLRRAQPAGQAPAQPPRPGVRRAPRRARPYDRAR